MSMRNSAEVDFRTNPKTAENRAEVLAEVCLGLRRSRSVTRRKPCGGLRNCCGGQTPLKRALSMRALIEVGREMEAN